MKIVLTGSIAIDRIMTYEGRFADVIQPDKLHILSLSVLLSDLKETRGGVAANIAYTLAILGESPILYGSVGNNGADYMSDLEKLHIDTSLVHFSSLPTASFSVITDVADCQVGGFYAGAMSDSQSLSIEEFADQEVFVVISPHDPEQMAVQVKECKKLKKRYCYDVGQQVTNVSGADLKDGIEGCELLIVNDYEMGVICQKTGWTQNKIISIVPTTVITLGEKGSVVWHNGKQRMVPAVKIKKVVDPTGAGDAYRAGFLFGYVRDQEPYLCAQIGSTAAAFTIEETGTQTHFFTKSQFKERYERHYGASPVLQ